MPCECWLNASVSSVRDFHLPPPPPHPKKTVKNTKRMEPNTSAQTRQLQQSHPLWGSTFPVSLAGCLFLKSCCCWGGGHSVRFFRILYKHSDVLREQLTFHSLLGGGSSETVIWLPTFWNTVKTYQRLLNRKYVLHHLFQVTKRQYSIVTSDDSAE